MSQNKYYESDEFQRMILLEEQTCNMSFPILDWNDFAIMELWDKGNKEKPIFEKAYKYFKDKNPYKFAFDSNIEKMYESINGDDKQDKYYGVDIPVLLGKENNNTIFIIGESPARDKKYGPITIGTPFAVAYTKDAPWQCNIYKYIFNRLVKSGYSVYITDAVKVWYNGMKGEKGGYKKHINSAFLIEEIDKISPQLIVTWGETARDAYKPINNNIKYHHQTHPVTMNWDRWESKMYKDSLQDKEPKKTVGYEYANNNEGDRAQYLAYYISEEILQELNKPKAVT